uniref:ABC transporter-related protein n=1 Tax=uncultured Acidobacteria bacterium A3 TaxID=1036853 RepID=F8TTH4_9BACT|nr:ABC transporter-related protein [uncultured Acidobacteria bacterium A3]
MANFGSNRASFGSRRPPAAVEVRDLRKAYRSGDEVVHLLDGVSFSIPAGQFFAITGVSGSGKTTLLNIMSGLDVPTSGDVAVFGQVITRFGSEARAAFRRDHLGFIFQFYNLMPTLTAEENVKLALELLPLGRSEMKDRAAHYLRLVGLAGKERRFPNQLSGGEQQRVAIARALAKQPLLILADEPTGSLDRTTGHSIMALMREATANLDTTVVVVTHDADISALADGALSLDVTRDYAAHAGMEVS